MDAFITGTGWVTPLGAGLDEVWDAIVAGTQAEVKELPGPAGRRPRYAAKVPPKLVDDIARNPRLRRSSNISLFAAAAALSALKDAGLDPAKPGKIAVICAVSDGGVIYTRKFYDQVMREGSGSPLLFPETVYNAPGSHIAALLGLDGISYTVVGDATAGLGALEMGVQLLATGEVDHCLVVGAEEADWILGEAYGQWRLLGPEIDIWKERGAMMADGAAAIVLSREGNYRLSGLCAGLPFFRRSEARDTLHAVLDGLPKEIVPKQVISSANGTYINRDECPPIGYFYGGEFRATFPKFCLGDAFGASALIQVICAVQRLRREPRESVLVPVMGLNQHVGAALFSAE
jgi:hypothetical protein